MNDKWFSLKKRYIGLDIFRIVAVIAVCAFHTTIHLGADYGALQSVLRMGAVFMTAFFMLSGYSLFVNYSSENVVEITNLKSFLKKRIIGLIPMYYVAAVLFIIFYFGLYLIGGVEEYSIGNELILAPVEILGIQSNFFSLFGYSHNSGTWFISCILVCYLLYPLLQEVAKQIEDKTKIRLILLLIAILLYSPYIVYRFQIDSIYTNPFFRVLELQ